MSKRKLKQGAQEAVDEEAVAIRKLVELTNYYEPGTSLAAAKAILDHVRWKQQNKITWSSSGINGI